MRQKAGKRDKKNKGFTLVELMVVTVLLSVVSLFLVTMTMVSRIAWEMQFSSILMRNEAKKAMETVAKELRQTSLSNPNGVVISPDTTGINFAVPNVVSQASIVSWRPVEFSYDAANQQLIRTENGANATTLARQVQSMQFTRINNVVTATIQTGGTTPRGTPISSLQTVQATMRN